MKKKLFTAIGLMSGTSIDGVDLSLIKSDGNNEFVSILDNYCEYEGKLREKIISLRKKINLPEDLKKYSNDLNDLEREITLFHSKLIIETIKNYKEEIDLIGFHGQTIFHNPEQKITKQLGDGNLLSQLTKKIVINNFRSKDIQNGGQGAPLAPIFHKLISKMINEKYRINFPINFLNIGGITNITHVGNRLYACDVGPGNSLIDEWIRKNSKNNYDDGGKFAYQGKIDELILNQAIENFKIETYDRSLDVNDFDLSFIRGLGIEDGSATITNFTAYLISKGIEYVIKKNKDKGTYFLCGGGRKNKKLIEDINNHLNDKEIKLENIDEYGFDGDFIESQTFAYLAIRSFLELPISFPETTRCNSPTIGGTINKNF